MMNGRPKRQATMMTYKDANRLGVAPALRTPPLVPLLQRGGLAETKPPAELE